MTCHSFDIDDLNSGCTQLSLVIVIWNGIVGGAENMSVELAQRLRLLGVRVTVLFIGDPEPLAERLRAQGIPYRSLALSHGRRILKGARRYAKLVGEVGPDGALLEERGLMCLALRAGGYHAPIVAVEHGSVLLDERSPRGLKRLARGLSRAAGGRAVDAEVAVSDFMLARMRRTIHAKRSLRIYNGIDPEAYKPPKESTPRGRLVIGCAARLVPGKGVDDLIEAAVGLAREVAIELRVAGDGPERGRLESLAALIERPSQVTLLGFVQDMTDFWRDCDIAVIPSSSFVESFSMVTLEAMASGRSIVAARNGAIPELINDGATGTLVPGGEPEALRKALSIYAGSPRLRHSHGLAARERAASHFHIDDCAQAYLALFRDLGARAAGEPPRPRWVPSAARPQP